MSQSTAQAAAAQVPQAALDPWPLDPAQVVAGEPQASGTVLWKSADSRLANGIWECTPGAFTWVHADETLCVVSGRATVTPEGADPVELEPGVIAFFAEGTKTHWQVHETLRKAFHLHGTEPLPF